MNKKFIYYFIAIVAIGSLPVTAKMLRTHFAPKESSPACALDKKVCPDDTTVMRVLPDCDFAACPVSASELLPLTHEVSTTTELGTTTKPIEATTSVKVTPTKKLEQPAKKVTIVSKIKAAVSTVITTITSPFTTNPSASSNPNDASIPASSYIAKTQESNTPASPTTSLPPADFAGQKYLVHDNTILSNDNKVIYTIPPEIISQVGSSNAGWTNTTINVIPLGVVPPILNAIPIKDLPGKYYLSENSFGSIEACEFSNKIFILDTIANTVTLMYEENSDTLSHDDPRACNSEIYLLATDADKLVIKYHTIGTNTFCDSAWSEPEKTFYLDVTKLSTEGMKKYIIPENLSATAEQEEEACRSGL